MNIKMPIFLFDYKDIGLDIFSFSHKIASFYYHQFASI